MKILNRNEVDIQTTWDLSSLFSDNESYALELESLLNDVTLFNTTYKTKLTDAQTTIDISAFPDGMYFLTLTNLEVKTHFKLLKTN